MEEEGQADTVQPVPDPMAPPLTAEESTGDNRQITGLLQTSGLKPEEASALGLQQGRYQLISRNTYFLEGGDSLEAYLGQCIAISGREKAWDETREQRGEPATYNRKIFVVEEVQPRKYTRCYFSDTLANQPRGREVVYAGRVERMQRPAPDIAYDYQLRLQEPYRDPDHPVEPGKLVETMPLFTASFEVLSKLEAAVRHDNLLKVKGIQQQGYAEQEAVWVLSAENQEPR